MAICFGGGLLFLAALFLARFLIREKWARKVSLLS